MDRLARASWPLCAGLADGRRLDTRSAFDMRLAMALTGVPGRARIALERRGRAWARSRVRRRGRWRAARRQAGPSVSQPVRSLINRFGDIPRLCRYIGARAGSRSDEVAMLRISLGYVYGFAKELEPLLSLPDQDTTLGNIFLPLWSARVTVDNRR